MSHVLEKISNLVLQGLLMQYLVMDSIEYFSGFGQTHQFSIYLQNLNYIINSSNQILKSYPCTISEVLLHPFLKYRVLHTISIYSFSPFLWLPKWTPQGTKLTADGTLTVWFFTAFMAKYYVQKIYGNFSYNKAELDTLARSYLDLQGYPLSRNIAIIAG